MKTILVIDDHSPEAEHAAAFALVIAQAVYADVLIADTVPARRVNSGEPVLAGRAGEPDEMIPFSRGAQLLDRADPSGAYLPEITELNISDYAIDDLIALINRKEIWMLTVGMPDALPAAAHGLKPDMQSVLNRVRCPLLLIPQNWELKKPQRVVYVADLRYCRQNVLTYLSALAASFDAGISIAHLPAKGLTDIVDSYATEIFQKNIVPHAHYEKVTLNNTRERDLHRAVDVMINGLHNDLLVFVNHRYHFEEIIGRRIGEVLPAEITIPVLIFPL
jgi:hypothetical protein